MRPRTDTQTHIQTHRRERPQYISRRLRLNAKCNNKFQFSVPQKVARGDDTVVRVCSLCPRLYITVSLVKHCNLILASCMLQTGLLPRRRVSTTCLLTRRF